MIHELNIDIAFFTESWRKSSGDEVIVKNLTPEGFKAVSFHRESGNGGGICIVHRESMTIDLKRIRTFHSFECCECNLTIKSTLQVSSASIDHHPTRRTNLPQKDLSQNFRTFSIVSSKSVGGLFFSVISIYTGMYHQTLM